MVSISCFLETAPDCDSMGRPAKPCWPLSTWRVFHLRTKAAAPGFVLHCELMAVFPRWIWQAKAPAPPPGLATSSGSAVLHFLKFSQGGEESAVSSCDCADLADGKAVSEQN